MYGRRRRRPPCTAAASPRARALGACPCGCMLGRHKRRVAPARPLYIYVVDMYRKGLAARARSRWLGRVLRLPAPNHADQAINGTRQRP